METTIWDFKGLGFKGLRVQGLGFKSLRVLV